MKYKLDVNSICGGGEVGEVVALWSCGGLFSVLLLESAAFWVGPKVGGVGGGLVRAA